MDFISLEEQTKMIGHVVTAVGCCGIKNDIEVEGVLTQVSPYAIVEIKCFKHSKLPCMVKNQTLKLVKTLPL